MGTSDLKIEGGGKLGVKKKRFEKKIALKKWTRCFTRMFLEFHLVLVPEFEVLLE